MNRMEQGIASIPRQTVIREQPHMLAYITPAEAMLLKQNGGSGLPSHGGVPEFGLWSSTFGGGNSFSQSVSNMTSGRDGAKYSGGEWQGDPSEEPTRTIQNGPLKGEKATIMGPTSFFDSNQNKPPEGWANYHGGVEDALYKEDDIAQAGMMGSGVNMAVNAGDISVDDGTTSFLKPEDGIRSGLPTFVTGEGDRAKQATILDILKPMQYASSEPSQNNTYLYQELLNMYQNPYA